MQRERPWTLPLRYLPRDDLDLAADLALWILLRHDVDIRAAVRQCPYQSRIRSKRAGIGAVSADGASAAEWNRHRARLPGCAELNLRRQRPPAEILEAELPEERPLPACHRQPGGEDAARAGCVLRGWARLSHRQGCLQRHRFHSGA